MHLTILPRGAFQSMMEPMAIPPFERFYESHAGEVLGYLTRLLGREAAEDAWQETFLRALRGYPQLRAHRGTITAHSEGPGTGAEFRVRLPIARSAS